ncbi:hypothetical protein [Nonomuraea sp. NPDC050691]|uniref:calcium-binding protein n=1 Tax=Nonomuraea sp. NPDC050691 TaxID=3155661 RepID=UPI0033C14E56
MSRSIWGKALLAGAALTGSALLLSAPANAFSTTVSGTTVSGVMDSGAAGAALAPVVVSRTGSTIVVRAGAEANGLDVNGSAGSSITVTDTLAQVTAGAGCQQLGALVRCSTVGVTRLSVTASLGDDAVRNNTNIPSTLSGGPGRDRVFGGSAADTLSGGTGDDILNGGAGTDLANGGADVDRCTAETEVNCEL